MTRRMIRKLATALLCTGSLAAIGCTGTGELTVTGLYSSQGQALAGDRCDELLMEAAEADTVEDEEAAKEEYRECVEDALEEDGRDGECRDSDDRTCDIILDEVADAIDRLREEGGMSEAPECDAPEGSGEEALCHLMAAYEACELDRDGDGDRDVDERDEDDRPDEGDDRPDEGDEDKPDEGDDRPDEDGEDKPDEGGEGGDNHLDSKTCEQIRDFAENVGEEDREFLMQERPECFDEQPEEGGENPDEPGGEGGENPDGEPDGEPGGENPDEGGGDAEAFCNALQEEIANADTEERKNELQEIFDRECTI